MKYSQTDYHATSIGALANGLCAVLSVDNIVPGGEPEDLVRFAFAGEAQRVLLFLPKALGTAVCDRFAQYMDAVKDIAPMRLDWAVPYPACNQNTLHTLFEGAPPQKESRLDLFDACSGKRRCAVVATKHHGIKTPFVNTEWIECDNDMATVAKAIDLLKQDCYDLIAVCVGAFDVMMDATPLYGTRCEHAFANHVKEFALLCDAAGVYQQYNTLVGFCPTYGAHKGFLCGKHNRHFPEDLNVTHYFGVVSGLKDKSAQEMLDGQDTATDNLN